MVLGATQVREGIQAAQALAMAAALAQYSLHPVSRALLRAGQTGAHDRGWLADSVREVAGQGVCARVRRVDSPESTELRLGSAALCGLVRPATDAMHAYLSDEHGWLATFELHEDVRADAAATVSALRAAGIAVHLLSGDSAPAVARVAAQVGITQFQGECTPQDKLDFLQQAQHGGRKVAVVGDGLNDGPVLAGAHVSFAFGQAVPLAQAQADFVVLGDQLGAVSQALLLARRTLRIVRQNLVWSAFYNATCVPLAVLGWLPAWLAGLGMGASSLVVVLNALRLSSGVGQGQKT